MERILVCRPALAVALKCPNKAMIIEYMVWSINDKKGDPLYAHACKDGVYYMWDTYAKWQRRMPWLGESTIRKYMNSLRKDGWVSTESLSMNSFNRTLYYTVDYAKVAQAYDQFEQMHSAESASSMCSDVADGAAHCVADGAAHCVADGAANRVADLHTKSLTKSPVTKRTSALELHKNCIPFDEVMGSEWLRWSKSMSPNGRFNLNAFANSIMKMRTKHEMTEEMISYMLTWIKADDFWAKNAISPASLLKPSPSDPGITKLDRVITSIKARKKSKSERVMDSILRTESEVMAPDYNPLRLT